MFVFRSIRCTYITYVCTYIYVISRLLISIIGLISWMRLCIHLQYVDTYVVEPTSSFLIDDIDEGDQVLLRQKS